MGMWKWAESLPELLLHHPSPDSWVLCVLGCDPLHAGVGWTHGITQQWQSYHVCGQDFKGRDKTCLHKGQVELGSSYLRHRPWLMWWRERVRGEASEGMGKTKIWAAFQHLRSPAAVGMNGKGSTVLEGVGASVNRVDSECWNQASSICQEARKRRHSQGGPRTLVYCHQVLSLKQTDASRSICSNYFRLGCWRKHVTEFHLLERQRMPLTFPSRACPLHTENADHIHWMKNPKECTVGWRQFRAILWALAHLSCQLGSHLLCQDPVRLPGALY